MQMRLCLFAVRCVGGELLTDGGHGEDRVRQVDPFLRGGEEGREGEQHRTRVSVGEYSFPPLRQATGTTSRGPARANSARSSKATLLLPLTLPLAPDPRLKAPPRASPSSFATPPTTSVTCTSNAAQSPSGPSRCVTVPPNLPSSMKTRWPTLCGVEREMGGVRHHISRLSGIRGRRGWRQGGGSDGR